MTHRFIKDVCDEISKYPRNIGSVGANYTKNFIKEFAIKHNLPLNVEEVNIKTSTSNLLLKAKKLITLNILNEFREPIEGKVVFLEIEKLRYVNTLDGYIPVILLKDILDIDLYKDKINFLKPKGVIFALVDFSISFYHRIFNYDMPVFSISQKDLEYLEELTYISLVPEKEEQGVVENIFFDIGRGPIVYIVASISSKEESQGAIYSASSVALSLGLAQSFCKTYNSDFKFRFFFTEDDKTFEGVRKHIDKKHKYVYYAISIFNMGWANKSCFYEDAYGENAIYMGDKFYKYVKSLNKNVFFVKSNTLSFLHAPFKNKDIKTLMFGSYPCIISNTKYDNVESLRFEELYAWFDILSGFLRRFHAL
ncbi:hypothetical protein JCM8795_14590 [Hydrogenobaculum acidophilum]